MEKWTIRKNKEKQHLIITKWWSKKLVKHLAKKRYLWCANLFNPNIWHFTLPQQSPLHFLFYCKVRRKGIISQKCEISTIELGGRLGGTWAAGRTPRENFLSPTLASFCAPPPDWLCIVACLGVVSFGEVKFRDGGEPTEARGGGTLSDFHFSIFVFNFLLFTSQFALRLRFSISFFTFPFSFLTFWFSLRHFAFRLTFPFSLTFWFSLRYFAFRFYFTFPFLFLTFLFFPIYFVLLFIFIYALNSYFQFLFLLLNKKTENQN